MPRSAGKIHPPEGKRVSNRLEDFQGPGSAGAKLGPSIRRQKTNGLLHMSPLNDSPSLDLAAIRARLENKQGPEYWRSLEELAETPEFQDYVKHEFPTQAELWLEPMSRRNLLKLMGAS